MNSKNRVRFGLTLLVVVLGGFALAQVLGGWGRLPLGDHADDGAHGHEGDMSLEDTLSVDDTVFLTPRQIDASGIRIVSVGRFGGQESRLSGWVQPVVDARAVATANVSGRVARLAVDTGMSVEAGQLIAEVTSGEAAALHAYIDAAEAEAEAARLSFERDLALVEQGVVARQELEASRARHRSAASAATAARAQVAAAGFPDADGRVAITSPIAGVVSAIQVAPGAVVAAGGVVAEIVDPRRKELVFIAPAAVASKVGPGSQIEVSGSAASFDAVVVGVASEVGERSGSAVIRAQAAPGALPPVGTPVAAVIVSDHQADVLTVPTDAVQTVAGRSVVFIVTDAGFQATPVLTGYRAGDRIEILRGLSGTERVAGANAFLLKAELAKGEAGHDH